MFFLFLLFSLFCLLSSSASLLLFLLLLLLSRLCLLFLPQSSSSCVFFPRRTTRPPPHGPFGTEGLGSKVMVAGRKNISASRLKSPFRMMIGMEKSRTLFFCLFLQPFSKQCKTWTNYSQLFTLSNFLRSHFQENSTCDGWP